ncbi:MAG: hypothetical protein AB1630_12665 [bacterium]
MHSYIQDWLQSGIRPLAIQIDSSEAKNQRAWLEGNLIEEPILRKRLELFSDILLREWDKKRRKSEVRDASHKMRDDNET